MPFDETVKRIIQDIYFDWAGEEADRGKYDEEIKEYYDAIKSAIKELLPERKEITGGARKRLDAIIFNQCLDTILKRME